MDTPDAYGRIVQRVFPGARLRARTPLKGGVSASVDALSIVLPSGEGRDVVLRCHAAAWKAKPNDALATEHALLAALRAAGMAVPAPLLVDTSSTELPTPFLVMERVDGVATSALDPGALPGALEQMAVFLSRLHALSLASLALPTLPRGDDPVAGAMQFLDGEQHANVRTAVSRRGVRPLQDALLHGDYWPGNLLWNPTTGVLAAVIDWEDAAIGDPWSDVACCRVELACAFGEAAMESFTARYLAASTRDPFNLPLWDVYVSAAALASMSDWGLPAEVEAARRRDTTAFLLRACAQLER